MRPLVFLVEEASMKAFLEEFLPRLLPGRRFICLGHEGKQDLEKSVPRKLRAWPDADFVVLRDNDGADCTALKSRLLTLCRQGGRPETLVRIVCQELEAWFLGAPAALAEAYSNPRLADLGRKAKFRIPDVLGSPSRELARLVPTFQKVDAARRLGRCLPLDVAASQSRSFQVFVRGICRLAAATDGEPGP